MDKTEEVKMYVEYMTEHWVDYKLNNILDNGKD